MHSVERYLRHLREIRATGANTPETSYYPALSNLLNEVGASLRPRVRCVMNLQNRGAGLPDGGLFTPDQLQDEDDDIIQGQRPSRGAIEVKPTANSAWLTADSGQVTNYWQEYGQVLVTNYRDFILVGRRADGTPVKLESFRLAETEVSFWRSAANPRAVAEAHGDLLVEYLKRVMLHAAPITTPEEVAWFLAAYARKANAGLERTPRSQLRALGGIRDAFEKALGITFTEREGDHFFRSSLIQTLFYGVFSSWVLWSRQREPGTQDARFDWRTAAWYLRVPVITALYAQLSSPTTLRPLGLEELLDWTAQVLDRVDRRVFFEHFAEEHAVQYFYEPFLQKFDPVLRKSLGVWYTPREVVKYQVARVDWALKTELGIRDGLADENVYILDPSCGTGAYLVEVLHRIQASLVAIHGDALVAAGVKRSAMSRVFGFELLPAPFVIAHLQLGLLMQQLGAPLAEGERPGVYLTNALTGWEPPTGVKQHLPFPGLEEERDLAEDIKRNRAILVILGNPPYDSFAKIARIEEERSLSNAYRTSERTRQPEGQGLNDLYIRFFRMAERRIVERTGRGVVCYISNYSWLDGLSHPAMRERYLDAFDSIRIDSLNGDRDRTGKETPDGLPDPSVFSTQYNPQGIREGTAIALLVRRQTHEPAQRVLYRDFWGRTKRADLLEKAETTTDADYTELHPHTALGLPFMPVRVEDVYLEWPLLTELMPRSYPGVKTSRDDVLVDVDRDRLVRRLEAYFDRHISHDEMTRLAAGFMQASARFNPTQVREELQRRGLLYDSFIPYMYRPFDRRWLYWEPETKLLDEKRTEYKPHVFEGNFWIEARERQPMDAFDRGAVVRDLGDNLGNGLSSYIPLYLVQAELPDQTSLFAPATTGPEHNISDRARAYVEGIGCCPEDLFFHAVAVLNTPKYRHRNAGALRLDWPRIPLPVERGALERSAALGRRVTALFDVTDQLVGVTIGDVRPELRNVAVVSRFGGGQLSAADGDWLSVRKRWGYLQGTAVFPGPDSCIPREYEPVEIQGIRDGAAALGLSIEAALDRLGSTTTDVPLNDVAYWKNVPKKVWEFTASGYTVLKKWLSYREVDVLGRALSEEEAREFRNIARRIAALLLVGPELDLSYEQIERGTVAWDAERTGAQRI